MEPPRLEARGIGKAFGAVRALEAMDLTVPPATFHAVIGENGAGKSTLVKCILGFYHADTGDVHLDGKPVHTTAETRAAGAGMVFQHFTLVPSMTVLENLVLARQDVPAILNWHQERKRLLEFLERAPFHVDIDSRVAHLAAGQKQKVEILKQLYLGTRLLILDEPTSVLTPAEASEVMGVLSAMVNARQLSVILITHKLREVIAFADEVTVLRRGRKVTSLPVRETNAIGLAELMMGGARPPAAIGKKYVSAAEPALELQDLRVRGDKGLLAVNGVSLIVRRGEILGIAGVSGNGQRELVQAIGGQRAIDDGTIHVFGRLFTPTREQIRETGLLTLPEEPLENATVPGMSVAQNLALRSFDQPPCSRMGWLLNRAAMQEAARAAIRRFSIRPPAAYLPIRTLSGGNVQRTVLARDLGSGAATVMVVANPCFGLDFAATAFVHNHLVELRNSGGAVLLVSEDLDEIVKLADRIVVMSEGAIAHETIPEEMDLTVIGRYMGGDSAHAARHV